MSQFILTAVLKKELHMAPLFRCMGGEREGNRSLQKATEAGPGPHGSGCWRASNGKKGGCVLLNNEDLCNLSISVQPDWCRGPQSSHLCR